MNSEKLFLVGLGRGEEFFDSTGPLRKGCKSSQQIAVTHRTLLQIVWTHALLENFWNLSSLGLWELMCSFPSSEKLLAAAEFVLAFPGSSIDGLLISGEGVVGKNSSGDVVQLDANIVHCCRVVAQEIFLIVSGALLATWLLLAILSEEMAHNDGEGNPDDQDLEHQPEVQSLLTIDAVDSHGLKIDKLHENKDTELEQKNSTQKIARENLCLKTTQVDQSHQDIDGVQAHAAPEYKFNISTVVSANTFKD
jgi:hypothetical protein